MSATGGLRTRSAKTDSALPTIPLILAEARTQVYGRCTHFKRCLAPGFTSRYGVKRLVWYEADAFRRERKMKAWRRAWKIELIEKTNPGWRDLYPEIC